MTFIRNYSDYIESNAEIMLGKPVVKGTRISVALILKKRSEGAIIKNVIAACPNFTQIAINAVLVYSAEVISSETVIAVV